MIPRMQEEEFVGATTFSSAEIVTGWELLNEAELE